MRFLVDAQLPRRLCGLLRDAGHDALHTLDLPLGNRTPDAAILDLAASQDRVVVTKDDDFVQSHLIAGRPKQLLLVATGNIGNAELGGLLRGNLAAIIAALASSDFVEVGRSELTIHD
jgi:predicted nuclease of predicted toxin-antitoxin system